MKIMHLVWIFMFLRFLALFAFGEFLWYLFTGTFNFVLIFICCIVAEILSVDKGYFEKKRPSLANSFLRQAACYEYKDDIKKVSINFNSSHI